MVALKILVTPLFSRAVKKLHAKDKKAVDVAIQAIAENPDAGGEEKGDLSGVFVYKFSINNQEILLAYRLSPDKQTPSEVVLLAVGPHENFYTQLKR